MWSNPTFITILRYVVFTYPIWLPLMLGIIFFETWIRFVRTEFVLRQGRILLEFKLPREITKSPQVMEIVLASMFQSGAASYFETYIDGKVRPWFSLELVSIEGTIHFYIWMHKKFKSLVETQMYAQYPEIEVHEVSDYAEPFSYDPKKYTLWGGYFKLTKPSAFPFKTYVDFGLDKDPKEEFKIEPMANSLEFLGSLGKGQQAWVQILIQAHKKTGLKEGEPHFAGTWEKTKKVFSNFFAGKKAKLGDIYHFENEDWKADAKEEINKLNESLKDPNNPDGPSRRPTKAESDKIAAIERKMSKLPFETMIRAFYIADKEHFDAIHIPHLIAFFRQYNSQELNAFKLGHFTDWDDNGKDYFRLFFSKRGQRLRNEIEHAMLRAYKLRSFFTYPFRYYQGEPYILGTEELATIFHFPGAVVATPNLTRIPSKKAEAPANLPI